MEFQEQLPLGLDACYASTPSRRGEAVGSCTPGCRVPRCLLETTTRPSSLVVRESLSPSSSSFRIPQYRGVALPYVRTITSLALLPAPPTHTAPVSFASRPPEHGVGTQVPAFLFVENPFKVTASALQSEGVPRWASVSSQTSRFRPHLTNTS